MIRWPVALAAAERHVTGPLDEFDEEVNGDPDLLTGEEDYSGFDEMGDWPDEALGDEGFDDAGDAEGDDDGVAEGENDEEEC